MNETKDQKKTCHTCKHLRIFEGQRVDSQLMFFE